MRKAVAPVLIGLSMFVLLVLTASDIGITYDEPIYISKSVMAWEWLVGGGYGSRDSTDRAWDASIDQQPGTIKLLFGIASGTLGSIMPGLAYPRVGTMLLSAVLVAALYWLVAAEWGWPAGAVAAGALAFMPRVWTHMHIAALDAPIMALSFFTVVMVYLAARRESIGLCIVSGVLFGLALGTKLNAFFIPFIVLPWLLYLRRWRIAAWVAGAMAVLGPLTVLLTWPWLWHDTWTRTAEYIAFHLHHYHVATTYFGTVTNLAPWHYAPVMVFFTTPAVVGLLVIVGLTPRPPLRDGEGGDGLPVPNRAGKRENGAVGPDVTRSPTSRAHREDDVPQDSAVSDAVGCRLSFSPSPSKGSRSETRRGGRGVRQNDWHHPLSLLLIWALVVNILPSMLPWAPKYNGVRLFLPIFPYLAAFAGIGAGFIISGLQKRLGEQMSARIDQFPLKLRVGMVAVLLVLLIQPVGVSHPFGMSYYTEFIGGTGGALRLGMEPTYWGDTYHAAMQWVLPKAPSGSTVWINVPGFASTVELYNVKAYRPGIAVTAGDETRGSADFLIIQHKQSEMDDFARHLAENGTPLHVVELGGAPLAWVFSGDDPAVKGAIEYAATQ